MPGIDNSRATTTPRHHAPRWRALLAMLLAIALLVVSVLFVVAQDLIDPLRYRGIVEGTVIDVSELANDRIVIIRLDAGGVFHSRSKFDQVGERVNLAVYTRLLSRRTVYRLFLEDE